MTATMIVLIHSTNPAVSYMKTASLEISINFTPNKDIQFEHPVWHDGQTPISIQYNVHDSELTLFFKSEIVKTNEEGQTMAEMYSSHGWTIR